MVISTESVKNVVPQLIRYTVKINYGDTVIMQKEVKV